MVPAISLVRPTLSRDNVIIALNTEGSGTEFIDRVDLGSGLVIEQQGLGVASHQDGFDGVDGILGSVTQPCSRVAAKN